MKYEKVSLAFTFSLFVWSKPLPGADVIPLHGIEAFHKHYDIEIPLADTHSITSIGSLFREEIDFSFDDTVLNYYHSNIEVLMDCQKVREIASLAGGLGSSRSGRNTTSELSLFTTACAMTEDDWLAYRFAATTDGMSLGNVRFADPGLNSTPRAIFFRSSLWKPMTGYLYFPMPSGVSDDRGYEHYTTLFMSNHHAMRLEAIATGKNLEPGIDCAVKSSGFIQTLLQFPSVIAGQLAKVVTDTFDFIQTYNEFVGKEDYEQYYRKELSYKSASEARYACLCPNLKLFEPDFDLAVESLEPMLLTYRYFTSRQNLTRRFYQTILPFFLFRDIPECGLNGQQSKYELYTPGQIDWHGQLYRESEHCLAERTSDEYNSRKTPHSVRYCLSEETRKWDTIELFLENELVLQLRGIK